MMKQAAEEIKQETERKAKGEEDKLTCRICLSEDEPGNPLISPCKCSGTMRFIHASCLQEWLESKKHKKETKNVYSYIWK